jgi:hypothetical protein
MKISVELSDSELKEICLFTGEKKKGPAIRKIVVDALMLKRREVLALNFISGKWGAHLGGFEKARAQDRLNAQKKNKAWRSVK